MELKSFLKTHLASFKVAKDFIRTRNGPAFVLTGGNLEQDCSGPWGRYIHLIERESRRELSTYPDGNHKER